MDAGGGSAEERLRQLVSANARENRKTWALEAKSQGKKVIGFLCPYTPEEVIHAAGMLPWRITGTWGEDVGLAGVYRPENTDLYYTHVLQAFLSGELDFLDGVIFTNRDDDLRRLADVWEHKAKNCFTHMLHVPRQDTELARSRFSREITVLVAHLEKSFHVAIPPDALHKAIKVYDEMRGLLLRLYGLRKREKPPLSGAECLGMTTAAMVMPREQFNAQLRELMGYLEGRQAHLKSWHPRLLVSSDMLDNPAYLELIEDCGALVAMDDLDTGSRYFWNGVNGADIDPVSALARRYLARPADPRMLTWPKQLEQTVAWAREFAIDAAIELPQMYSYPREFRVPYFREKLTEAGIPVMSIKREYRFAGAAQLMTRVQAFLEMVEATPRRPAGRAS